MGSSAPETLRRLPLHEKAVERGARMGAFGQWEVPLYYSSILEEHQAVRNAAGLFDISHMGEFRFLGKDAPAFLNSLLPRNVESMTDGKALYMPLLNDDAGIIDDVIVYRWNAEDYLLIVNAGNIETDEAWIRPRVPASVEFRNESEHYGLLALQGPASQAIAERVLGRDALPQGYYRFKPYRSGMISSTGYTGEAGFEIMLPKDEIVSVWEKLMDAGKGEGIRPIGFGARDTLRLEAGMLLHGHDMNDTINPVEAGIDWACDFSKSGFTGEKKLREAKEKGPVRRLVGFEMQERGIPREGYAIMAGGKTIGKVTSGTLSPTLQKNIGLGYVEASYSAAGTEIGIVIRERETAARVMPLPFYKRNKKKNP